MAIATRRVRSTFASQAQRSFPVSASSAITIVAQHRGGAGERAKQAAAKARGLLVLQTIENVSWAVGPVVGGILTVLILIARMTPALSL